MWTGGERKEKPWWALRTSRAHPQSSLRLAATQEEEEQYFGHLMQRADSFEKTLMLGKIEGRRRRKLGGWG